jgi:hypothetical protein
MSEMATGTSCCVNEWDALCARLREKQRQYACEDARDCTCTRCQAVYAAGQEAWLELEAFTAKPFSRSHKSRK